MAAPDLRAKKPHRGLARLLIALIAGAILWSLRQMIAPWGGRTWAFVSAVGVIFIVILLLGWVVAAVGRRLYRFARSVARSIWKGIANDLEVRALRHRYPRLTGWLARRTTSSSWNGIYLTLTVVAFAYFLFTFVSIAQRAATTNALTGYDAQLSGLLRSFRTPDVTRFLWVFTILGDSRVAFSLTAIAVLLLLLWGRRLDAILLAVAVGGGSLLGDMVKLVFRRARPATFFALVTEPAGFSFPSGHALYAVLFWGVIGFLLIRASTTMTRKVTAFIVCAAMAIMTALSRVYLGVHWTSDVMASWALAFLWLSPCIGAYLIWLRYREPMRTHPVGTLAMRRAATVGAVLLGVGIVLFGTTADPVLKKAAAVPTTIAWQASVDASGQPAPTPAQAQKLPRTAQMLGGAPEQPVSLVYVGTQAQLSGALSASGWTATDPSTPLTFLHAFYAAFSNVPYPRQPPETSFVDGQVETFAFEKQADGPPAWRHCSRWWLTDFTFAGRPVWVGTASLDTTVTIGGPVPALLYHAKPNIDAEQALVANDLRSSGALITARVRLSTPRSGFAAAGDQWYTEGEATVLAAEE